MVMLMNESIKEIPIASIITSGFNPRKTFDPEYIKELADSIQRDGQWNPIIVKHGSDQYELIAGECRLRAFKKLGLTKIKARVLNVDDDEAHLLALKTNLMRHDLNPVEEAYGIKKLIDMGWSVDKVAKELNKSRSWVYVRSKLVEKASKGLQNALITQTIPISYAIKISELSEGLQGPMIEKIVRDRLIFKEVNFIVDLLKGDRTPEELESIFKAPRERIINWASERNPFSENKDTKDKAISIIECSCGTKFIVDWTSKKIISEQNHRKRSFFEKTLRFLRKKG